MSWNPYELVKQNENPPVHFNTGTMFDYLTGPLVQGYDGEWYCNGGLSCLMYILQGLTNSYKSTMLDSMTSSTLAIYRDMFSVMHDTENHKLGALVHNKQKDIINSRYDFMAKQFGCQVSDRIVLSDKVCISDILAEIIDLRDDRLRHAKDLTIETPFLNSDGKRIRALKPIIIGIDSFSSMESPAEADLISKHALEDSKTNMLFVQDGKRKAVFSRALKALATSGNMIFLCTGHTGEKQNFDNIMAKPKKATQWMKAGQVIKGIGGQTTYGAQVVIETSSTTCTTSDGKEVRYPVNNESPTNLNEVSMLFQKGKNNISGAIFKFIVTQTHGLNSALTNVDYVKSPGTNGFNYSGSGNAFFSTSFTPDTKSSRKTVREHLDDSYELRRAFELIAQIKFISENIPDKSLIPVPIGDIDLNKSCEKLIKGDGALIQDILNSRGYWTYCDDPRPYMSVYKVLDLLYKD